MSDMWSRVTEFKTMIPIKYKFQGDYSLFYHFTFIINLSIALGPKSLLNLERGTLSLI